jgi:hypothetical protein
MIHRIMLLVLGVSAGVACSDRRVEEHDEVDVQSICSDHCELRETCSPGAPETVAACPGSGVSPTCYDDCLMSGGPGRRKDLGTNWTDSCRFLRADYYECVNALTCDEWYTNAPCTNTPWDQQPCAEENDAYGNCVGRH